MSDATMQRAATASNPDRLIVRGLWLLIAVVFLLKLHLVFVANVNWDEFFFLDKVHAYRRGALTIPLQTIHVHLFTWLRHISANEVDQIIAARLVIYTLAVASGFFIYRIGRRFLDRAAALFALLCYLAFSYVVEHGTSFRFDPIATCLILASVYGLLCRSSTWLAAIASGLAMAMALLVTIKSAFYLPVLGLLLLIPVLRRETRRGGLGTAVLFTGALVAGFLGLFLLHRASLNVAEVQDAAGFAASAADKVIRLDNLFPRWRFFLHSLVENAVVWACLGLGSLIVVRQALRSGAAGREQSVTLLLFLLPLGSLLFYRNAFPYFYVFLLPLACLACGVFFAALLKLQPGKLLQSPRLLALGLLLAVSVTFGKSYLGVAAQSTQVQRETIDLVHRLFPEPVPYIDRCSMISSFPKVGFFMSSWGMETYLGRGRPIFRDLIAREQPLFLIANIPSLDPGFPQERIDAAGGYRLLDEDYAQLRSNYLHHWGLLYVAGKRLSFSAADGSADFELLIAGTYTLEATAPLAIDGKLLAPGETVWLAPGRHRATAPIDGPRTAALRWGEGLFRPAQAPTEAPVFAGF